MKYFLTLIVHDFHTKFIRQNYLLNIILATLLVMFALYSTSNGIFNAGIIILPLAITCIIQNNSIFEHAPHSCFLEQIITSGCPSYTIVLSKFCVTYTTLCITAIITLLFFSILYTMSLSSYLIILKLCLIYSIPLSSISLFTSALTIKIKNSQWLGLLIGFPLTLIFFLYLSSIVGHYIGTATIYHDIHAYLQVLYLLSLISFIVSIFSCSYLISKI